MKTLKNIIIFSAVSAVFFAGAHLVLASSPIGVSPTIINEKMGVRDINTDQITITNNANFRTTVYVFTQDVFADGTEKNASRPSDGGAEYAGSLAGWLSIPRNVQLAAGESEVLDLKIDPSVRAEPGVYHATLTFSYGNNKSEAESRLENAPKITLNLEILDNSTEAVALQSFSPDKTFFTGFPITFSYSLDNRGDVNVGVNGEIRVYDRRGKEVAAVPVSDSENSGEIAVGSGMNPGDERHLSASLTSLDGFGRYKAVLDARYGNGGSMQDTAFFWVVPVHLLILLFVLLVGLFAFFIYVIHLRYERWYHHHYTRRVRVHGSHGDLPRPRRRKSYGRRNDIGRYAEYGESANKESHAPAPNFESKLESDGGEDNKKNGNKNNSSEGGVMRDIY